ncbi:hypothetical protein [Sphingobium sp. YR768]|uniref:hypothetical protein n=1 Tax=Sphingobium sp. YR768 TaxID=1884365 RepID=UPI00115FAE1C|nr:hypothetical protein [Sphingobium sp. YR768]
MIDRIFSEILPGIPKAQTRMITVPFLIGQFVMTWAKHERMLAGMLSRIRQVDYVNLRDNLLDSQISSYEIEIRKTIHDLGPDHDTTPYLHKIIIAHVPLRQLRNDIVHGFWAGIGPDEEYVLKRKPRKGEDTSRTLELQELSEGYKNLDQLGVTIINAGLVFEGKDPLPE